MTAGSGGPGGDPSLDGTPSGAAPPETGQGGVGLSGVATGGHPGPAGGPPRGVLNRTPLKSLGHQARSVVVPAALVVLLSIGGMVMAVIAVVGLIGTLSVSDGEIGPSECQARTSTLQAALGAYRTDEGRAATEISELDPYLQRSVASHTIDFSTSPPSVVVVEGGGCDDLAGSQGARVSDDLDERAQASIDAVEIGFTTLYVVGYLVVVAGVFLQGWWLARAYRCMPVAQQRRSPRSAYSPFIVYLTGLFLYSVTVALVAVYDLSLGLAAFLLGAGGVLVAIFFVAALLRWISMLGDVNFAFGRHTAPARLMRICLVWFLIGCFALPALLVLAGLVSSGQEVVGWALLVVFGLWLLLPIVGQLAYVIAVLLATWEIEVTLRAAAQQLSELQGRGWLAVSTRKQRVHR